jgi:hypothetical protein
MKNRSVIYEWKIKKNSQSLWYKKTT